MLAILTPRPLSVGIRRSTEGVVERDKRRDLAQLTGSGYIPTLEAWAKGACAPVFFRTPAGKRCQGTMTFVDTGEALLGLTAGHVAKDIRSNCDGRPGYGCQVGAAELDPARLIAIHPTLDLASFRLSEPFLAAALNSAVTVPTWPPRPMVQRDLVMYGGYPGMFRDEGDGRLDVGFVWFAALVESASEHQAGTVLRIEQSLTAGVERVPAHANLGGWSGGPVFRLLEGHTVERLELAGIIYEYTSDTEIVLAHSLKAVRPDGSLDGAIGY